MKKRIFKHTKTLALILCAAVILSFLPIMIGGALAAPFDVGPRSNSTPDPANGIYVSPDGNDATANGSISAPYKSINAALAAAQPGATIILRGGTYREGQNVRVRQPNITIKSRQGEWAVIDLTTYNSGHNEDSGVYFDVDSSGGKLQGVEVIGGFYTVCMETKWDWGQPDRSGASNIIIADCKLHDSRYDTVKVKPNCDNITIRYNEIYNSGRAFVGNPPNGEDNAEGIDNVNGDNMIVQNNYIHDIRGNGIYAKGGATDALIENNLIEHVFGAGIMVGFDTSPEFFDLTVNPQYYENIRGVVRNNLIMDIGWEGIGLYGSKDAQVYNNTLVNVANGVFNHSAIYFGLTYQDWESYAGRPANVNPNIHQNVVSQPASFNRQMIEIRYSNDLGGMSALSGNPTMGSNCYYIAGKSTAFTDNRPGRTLTNAGLAAWKTHIGGDNGSIEVDPALDNNYVATNPQCAGMGISGSSTTPPPTPPPATYLVTVNNGTGDGNYTAGATVTITAGTPPAGQQFKNWTVNSGGVTLNNANSATTTFTMPANAVTVTANFEPIPQTTYLVTVSNGTGGGSYAAGATVTITAGTPPAGQQFKNWTVNSGGVTLSNANSATAMFTMPANAVSVTANFETIPPETGQTTYNIADFYSANGQLLVKRGDIIVVGQRQYSVLSNTYTIQYWSQNSLNAAISWWTDYMNSFAAGGAVEEITGAAPAPTPEPTPTPGTGATYNIADIYAKSGSLSVKRGDIVIVGTRQYSVLSNTYTIQYWSQNSLNAAISWWTDYMNSFAAGGVVAEA